MKNLDTDYSMTYKTSKQNYGTLLYISKIKKFLLLQVYFYFVNCIINYDVNYCKMLL